MLIRDDSKDINNSSETLKSISAGECKGLLRRKFYCSKNSFTEKVSKFYLNKMDQKNKLGLDLTFDEIMDIVLPIFRLSEQDTLR